MSVPYNIKQVIVFRKDLKVRKGKFASQIAHACMKVFFDRKLFFKGANGETLPILGVVIPGPPQRSGSDWPSQPVTLLFPEQHLLVMNVTSEMEEWYNTIFAKVVLFVDNEADLLRAYQLAQDAGLPCSLITDVGNTEFHGVPTHTAIAIGPAATVEIDKITGTEGLIKTELA